MEDHRVNCLDGTDDSNLEDGVGDMGLTQMIMKVSPLPSTTASSLPPHVKAAQIVYHYKQQEQ